MKTTLEVIGGFALALSLTLATLFILFASLTLFIATIVSTLVGFALLVIARPL